MQLPGLSRLCAQLLLRCRTFGCADGLHILLNPQQAHGGKHIDMCWLDMW